MAVCYIGIGSNLGNRKENIHKSLQMIEDSSQVKILKVSSFIETMPENNQDMPKFLNAAAKIDTFLNPQYLLSLLKKVEAQLGRVDKGNNLSRTIDLDILLYEDRQINTPDLTIPHPKMFQRAFVLQPLLEIEPDIKGRFTFLDKYWKY